MTFKPTLEMALLMQRSAEGDLVAFAELWPLIMDEPLDTSRDLEGLVKEMTTRIESLTPAPEPAKPSVADIQNSILAVWAEFNRIFDDPKMKRRLQ